MTEGGSLAGAAEVELKLRCTQPVTAKQLTAILSEAIAAGPITKPLDNTYFDTEDERLRRRKAALRVRRTEDQVLQTLKLGQSEAALQRRAEWEMPIAGPDIELERFTDPDAKAALGLLFDGQLKPVFQTKFERQKFDVRWPAGSPGASDIEVALDRGSIKAGKATAAIGEIELELKDGSGAHVLDLARALGRSLPVRPSLGNKSERGYWLAGDTPPPYVKASKLEFAPDMAFASVVTVMLRDCLAQWMRNEAPATDGRDSEGVHQLRVGIRRLRSLLTLLRPWLVERVARDWSARLRDVFVRTGPARQIDVLIEETLQPLQRQLPDDEALATVMKMAGRAKARAYDEIHTLTTDPEVGRLLLDLVCWVELGEWRAVNRADVDRAVADVAAEILEKRYKSVRKGGRGFKHMPMFERHQLRLRLKKLRYAVDFFQGAFDPDKAGNLRKKLASLQDELGLANDLAESEHVLASLSGPKSTKAEREALARVDGIVLGWSLHRQAAQEEMTAKAWKAFTDAPRFWAGVQA